MSMAVTLVSGAYPDNRQHAGIYSNAAAQTAYFDSLDKITRECKTVPLGDDIYFSGTIAELKDRAYGWIDYGDGFRYYFSIYDYDFVSTESTRILYKVDIYETYLFHGLRFGRAALERAPQDIGRPMMAIGFDHTVLRSFNNDDFKGGVIALGGWNSAGNQMMTTLANFFWDPVSAAYAPWLDFMNGKAHELLWDYNASTPDWCTTPGDLKHGMVYPDAAEMRIIEPEIPNSGYVRRSKYSTPTDERVGIHMLCNTQYGTPPRGPVSQILQMYFPYTVPQSVESDRFGFAEIRDMRGNTIFKPDFGEQWLIEGRAYQITLSGSSMLLKLTKRGTDEVLWVPMPGESLDAMVDTWAEYDYRQRECDMRMRELQNQKQLVQGLSSVGTQGMEGAIGGKFADIGARAGAAAGVISSLAGALANYAANEFLFNDQEQGIIDAQMHKAADSVNFLGTSAQAPELLLKGQTMAGVWKWDFNTASQISEDIRINGFPVDYRGDMPQLSEGAWKGQVEVLDLPGAWRDQVMQRFAGGVVIGRLG